MKEIRQLLKKQLKKLNARIREIQTYLESSSPGILVVTHSNGGIRFYQSLNGARKYLNKNDKAIITSLANNNFLSQVQNVLIKQSKTLEKALSLIESVNIEQSIEYIYNNLSPEKKELVAKDELDNSFAQRWQAIGYKRKHVPEEIPFYTDKNEHVRSKSELIIANALNKREIPYHYECKLTLGNITLRPDFTILNKRTREIYIWEHFGMMDNSEYSSKVLEKLECYATNNYYMGKNLIITAESTEAALNTKSVEDMINKFLV